MPVEVSLFINSDGSFRYADMHRLLREAERQQGTREVQQLKASRSMLE